MDFTILGKTGLRVSVAGIGCGGFSRLGLSHGRTEAEAADVVRTALDLGVNYIDTAASYETEGAVGQAIRRRDRGELVIATKGHLNRGDELLSGDHIQKCIDSSLKALGTDYIDVYQLHAPQPHMFDHLIDVALPVLLGARASGKIRHIGVTEAGRDHRHELLLRAALHDAFDVMLVAFHMMHQTARNGLFAELRSHQIGTVIMYAVRNLFARPERLRQVFQELSAAGEVPVEVASKANPLDFLLHKGGAQTPTEAAYRFARHEPGVHVVLFGTGDPAHVRTNVSAILKPPLPPEDLERIRILFSHLAGVGLDKTPRRLAMEYALRTATAAAEQLNS
jgi:L-galactose dehydrogenase